MSAGPIRAERRGHVAPAASTSAKDRVCAESAGLNSALGRSYCGRRGEDRVDDWADVTCSECLAARRADIAAQGGATR